MTAFIIRRLLSTMPTVMLLLFVVVVLVRLIPGDAVDIVLAEQGNTSPEAENRLREQLGLNDNVITAYVNYGLGALRGDLGHSLWTDDAVLSLILSKMVATLEVTVLALILGAVIGVLGGAVAAMTRGTPLDHLLRAVAILLLSIPSFALGTAVIVLPLLWTNFSVPVIYERWSDDPVGHLQHLIAPVLVVTCGVVALLMRLTRTSVLDVLASDYVRTARAKGLRERLVIWRHVLRNALIPSITLLGLSVPLVISGSVVVESMFGIPGTGSLLQSALGSRDYPIIQGLTLIAGLVVITTTLLVDISYTFLDPRIRLR